MYQFQVFVEEIYKLIDPLIEYINYLIKIQMIHFYIFLDLFLISEMRKMERRERFISELRIFLR